jgi:hypothetical protein
MSVDVLTIAAPVTGEPIDFGIWIRRVLQFGLLALGVVLTLWIVTHLGPVAYGLPAPFFRRRALVPVQA